LRGGVGRTGLHSQRPFLIVFAMRARLIRHPLYFAALAFLLVVLPCCGSKKEYDWKNRDLAWAYAPTKGGAILEHLRGTGTKGSPIAHGWKCLLIDGDLTIKPYELSKTHALFGKTKMVIDLFNKSEKKIGTVRTGTITKDKATFSFEIKEDVAKQVWDVIIWFVKV
jgi:hypothetical protein